MTNIAKKALEVKMAGTATAIECGTLDVMLSAVHMQNILLMPLQRTSQYGPQVLREFFLHVTAQPHRQAPIYYTSFLVAAVMGVGQAASLTFPFPYRGTASRAEEALATARELQQQAFDLVQERLKVSKQVGRLVTPARYRLPDEWVFAARGQGLVYQEGQWRFAGGEVSHDE